MPCSPSFARLTAICELYSSPVSNAVASFPICKSAISITSKCPSVSISYFIAVSVYFGAYFFTSFIHSSFILCISFSSSALKFGFLKNKLACFVLSHPCLTSLSSTPASSVASFIPRYCISISISSCFKRNLALLFFIKYLD